MQQYKMKFSAFHLVGGINLNIFPFLGVFTGSLARDH